MMRFRYRLRTVVMAVTIVCAALVGWKKLNEFPLTLGKSEYLGFVHLSGRFFMWRGSNKEELSVSLDHALADGCHYVYDSHEFSDRQSWSRYNVNFDLPAYEMFGDKGRFDLCIRLSDGRETRLSFGDLTIQKPPPLPESLQR